MLKDVIKTSSNYHQSGLSLARALVVKVEETRDCEEHRETDRCQQNFTQLERGNFLSSRCGTGEDILFLSDAAGRDGLHRDLYNDWLCH